MHAPNTPVDLGDSAVGPTLDQIPSGSSVRVHLVVGEDPIARRLGELGIRAGVEIEVLRRAPLGDPTLFELCGYQLCLRQPVVTSVTMPCGGHARGEMRGSDQSAGSVGNERNNLLNGNEVDCGSTRRLSPLCAAG